MFLPDTEDRRRPIYEQLYRYYRDKIESGGISAGEKLPSRRWLASHLKLSPGTIESAYAQLAAEGYVVSKNKSGYYVNDIGRLSFGGKSPHFEKTALHAEAAPRPAFYRYSLSTNRVGADAFPFSTWAKLMRECLTEENKELLIPSDPKGDFDLRTEIIGYLSNYRGIKASPEQLVVGSGSEFLLGLLVQLIGRDIVYAVENPGYRKTEKILSANGAVTTFASLDDDGIPVSELDRLNASVVHVTPSHHFPLGGIMPVSRRKELLTWASGSDRYIIEDDYDSEFRFSGRPIPSMLSLDIDNIKKGRVIYTNTFTKSLSPSLRISYILLPEELLDRYERFFSFYYCSVPNFEQRTLWRFMARGYFERHLNRVKTIYRSRRDAFLNSLCNHEFHNPIDKNSIGISGLDSGLHLVLNIRNGMNESELVESARCEGVEVSGLSEYYHSTLADVVNPPESTVVVGYSEYGNEELEDAALLLRRAWFGVGRNKSNESNERS